MQAPATPSFDHVGRPPFGVALRDAMSTTAAAFAVGNVLSSVSLVLVNKLVFSAGFKFPLSLSFCHFCFTVVFYRLLRCAGFYEANQTMPQIEKFKVALAGFASIGFMNLSLNSNSVGFYQITKLTIIPVTLAINLLYGVHTNGKIKLALLILLAGVGVATVTDVQLRPIGLVYGALAVLTTAVFQIWQGSKQKEFSMSGTQLQAAVAPWMAAQSLAVAAAAEGVCWKPDGSCPKLVQDFVLEAAASDDGVRTLGLVLATCFLALAVNFCSFGLIGRTSPITFQVVGHLKTCLVLVGGYVLFTGKHIHKRQLQNNIIGVSVAMVGCVLYGHLKHAASQSQDDCFDCICPAPIVRCLDAEKAKVAPTESERETLTAQK